MTASAFRTLVVGGNNVLSAREMLLGYPRLWWPDAEPGEFLDYTLDVTEALEGDSITAASLSVSPSGSGELIPAFLNVSSNRISWWGYGGIAGRDYHICIKTQTVGLRNPVWTIGLSINPLLASYCSTLTLANSAFSPEITWAQGQFMLGPIFNLPAITVAATGTTQLTAAPVPLAKVLVNAGAGLSISLPQASTFNGQGMPVYNRTSGTLTIFPYAGDTIESNGANAGITLQNDQSAHFSVTNSGLLILS